MRTYPRQRVREAEGDERVDGVAVCHPQKHVEEPLNALEAIVVGPGTQHCRSDVFNGSTACVPDTADAAGCAVMQGRRRHLRSVGDADVDSSRDR
jgi:hypothetical protein